MIRRKYGNVRRWRSWGIVIIMLLTGLALILAAVVRPDAGTTTFKVIEMTPGNSAPEGDYGPDSVAVSPDVSPGEAPGTGETLSDDRPVLALLVDDFGYNAELAGRLSNLDLPMTWAILPGLRYSGEMARLAGEKGIPFFLHLPMQAGIDGEDGPFLVGTAMNTARIAEVVEATIASLPGLCGVNNHRGSKATSDARTMEGVLDVIDREGLLFVDSRTSSESVAFELARKRGIPAAYNKLFLDNEADVQSIREKLGMVIAQAQGENWALAICHVRPGTVEFLEELDSDRPENIRFVTVPELISILGSR